MSRVEVACAADAGWVPHSAAMLHSLLTAGGGSEVRVHYLHRPDVAEADLERLGSLVEGLGGSIAFLRVDDERLRSLATTEILPTAHWYRIFLPQLLPELDRVLYLDGDLIVRRSPAPLWETELGDAYLAAVTNVFAADQLARLPRLGFDDPNAYFNSGVMLLNLAALRAGDTTAEVVEWATAHRDRIDIPDQDALNAVLGHRRVHLHPRWNLMTGLLLFPWAAHAFGFEALAEARRDPAIRHFEGPYGNKPWHYLCEADQRELYAEHRRRTPWPDFEPEGRTAVNVARKASRRFRRP